MSKQISILVCGGGDYSNYKKVKQVLDKVYSEHEVVELIHGGAKGADSLAERYAREKHKRSLIFPAEWGIHGRSAGIIRNKDMLRRGKPFLVIAFPGGRGTSHMVRIAEEAGVRVICIDE